MPPRVLTHRRAPVSERGIEGMTRGRWSDVTTQGQFLLDLEFLTRHVPLPGREAAMCVITRCPPYLKLLASQFPWVHFYAYQWRSGDGKLAAQETCRTDKTAVFDEDDLRRLLMLVEQKVGEEEEEEEEGEYNPDQPGITAKLWKNNQGMTTVQTERNRTMSRLEFDMNEALRLSKQWGQEEEPRRTGVVLLICHGEDSGRTRQVALHALLRADHSLLDMCGSIPDEEDYLDGELVLPIMLPRNKVFACLVASKPCLCVRYDRKVYEQEMGFFQGTLRGTEEAYDVSSRNLIVGDYVRRFQGFYPGAHPDGVRLSLEGIVNSLEKEAQDDDDDGRIS